MYKHYILKIFEKKYNHEKRKTSEKKRFIKAQTLQKPSPKIIAHSPYSQRYSQKYSQKYPQKYSQ